MMEQRSSTSTTYRVLPASGAAPIPERTVPQYRWPSERRRLPERCDNCSVLLLLPDVPTVRGAETEVSCWSCSRVAYELISDLTPRQLTPEQFRTLPTNQGHRGRPLSATDISIVQARNAIGDARKQGHTITCGDGAYRLEASR